MNQKIKNNNGMVLVAGEVLYDVFPDSMRMGGAPFNFAFHLIQMGVEVKFLTRLGADPDGEELLGFMKRWGVDLAHVQIDRRHKTGRVLVYPNQGGGHRFDILRNAAYDFITVTDETLRLLRTPPVMIYFGTLIQRTSTGCQAVDRICRSRSPETVVFYDINLRPDCYRRDIVHQSLSYADILKLNDEELVALAEMFGLTGDTASKIQCLIEEYALTMVALTKGRQGSEVFTAADHIVVPPSRGFECVDTVGAGDAFAAVLAAGYLRKRDMRQILPAAADFAGRICGIPGAVPENKDIYKAVSV